jgi:hypothetical protein
MSMQRVRRQRTRRNPEGGGGVGTTADVQLRGAEMEAED